MTSLLLPSNHVPLLSPICRPLMNGAKCANCEMQNSSSKELFYVPLQPRTNEDDHRKQVSLRVNACGINNLGLCRVKMEQVRNLKEIPSSLEERIWTMQ